MCRRSYRKGSCKSHPFPLKIKIPIKGLQKKLGNDAAFIRMSHVNPCERFQCKANLSQYMAVMLQAACSESACESHKAACGAWMIMDDYMWTDHFCEGSCALSQRGAACPRQVARFCRLKKSCFGRSFLLNMLCKYMQIQSPFKRADQFSDVQDIQPSTTGGSVLRSVFREIVDFLLYSHLPE